MMNDAKRILSAALVAAVWLTAGQGPALGQQDPDEFRQLRETLRSSVKALARTGNYTFRYAPELETDDEMLRRFTERLDRGAEGRLDRKLGVLWLKSEAVELARKGGRVAVRIRGEWSALEDTTDEGKRETDRRDAMIKRMLHRLAGKVVPDERGAVFVEKMETLKREEKKETVGGEECTIYGGRLSTAGAEDLLMEPLGPLSERFGAEVGAAGGTAQFLVGGDGALRKLVLSVEGTFTVSFRGEKETFKVEAKYATSVERIGSTELDLAEKAKEILGLERKEDDKDEEEQE
ncbi:MAG: hypothetical protein ACYTAF_06690 [Planctomycetota bacterium]|jgi:hypothetical protein